MDDVTYRLVRPAGGAPAPPPVLDDAQRAVVEHAGGPLLVLAGPGTGKTTTLVETVVARADAGVPIENMLMLTFSRRAAGELRDRVAARLNRTIREPIARTLHSYAFGILRLANQRGAELDVPLPPPRLLSGAEQDVIVRDLLAGRPDDAWPVSLRPAVRTSAFAGELRDLLQRAVERGLLGDELSALGRARKREDWVAAGAFLTEYEDVTSLGRPGAYDPAELIRSATNALRADSELLAAERARRRRVFVDEYQDTDPAQAELLALVAEGADELVLVGDPDQSIYAFRGADESAIRDVDVRFNDGDATPVIALQTCRRSGPVLVAATRRIAGRLPGPAAQRDLRPSNPDPGTAEVAVFGSSGAEAGHVANVLRRAHLEGLAWSRMAVLVRSTTTLLAPLRRALLAAGVPVAVRGEELPLAEQPAVVVLLELVSWVLAPDALDEQGAERLLSGPVGRADVIMLQRLRRAVSHLTGGDGHTPAAPLAPLLRSEVEAGLLPQSVRWPVLRLQRVLAAGREAAAAGGSPEDVLWAVWESTSLAQRWESTAQGSGPSAAAAHRDLDAVIALFDAAARFVDQLPRATSAQFVAHVLELRVAGGALNPTSESGDAVQLLTAHASKGLEWDLVCVAGVQEGVWPDLRRRGSLLGVEELVDAVTGHTPGTSPGAATRLAEERRLFYVAATRARSRLLVTAVRGEDEQPSRFLDEIDPRPDDDGDRPISRQARPSHLSGLVAHLRAVVCDEADTEARRRDAARQLARLADAGVRGADPAQWWGLVHPSDDGPVARPDAPVAVSPSRLENFLRCELRSVLQDLGGTDGEQVSASLGTLVHEVAASAPPDADLDTLEAMIDERWGRLDFGIAWHAENERVRARGILLGLVNWLRDSRAKLDLVGIEIPFRVEMDRDGDAGVVLAGRVDRVERDADGRLVIVDLKTGSSKPTKDELPRHPQLAAYQLAVDEGGFGEGERAGGALLVQLGKAATKDPEQKQPVLADDDRQWIGEQITYTATRLRGGSFTAIAGQHCGHCDLRAACPLHVGRQVTT